MKVINSRVTIEFQNPYHKTNQSLPKYDRISFANPQQAGSYLHDCKNLLVRVNTLYDTAMDMTCQNVPLSLITPWHSWGLELRAFIVKWGDNLVINIFRETTYAFPRSLGHEVVRTAFPDFNSEYAMAGTEVGTIYHNLD